MWEELPAEIKLALEAKIPSESKAGSAASLFEDSQLAPHERRVYALLKSDEALQIDEIIEKLEGQLSSSEIFAALFELELAGKLRQLPGKNYVRSM